MTPLTPLESLYEAGRGENVALPPELAAVYGRLQIPQPRARPYVIANFVSTLDGIVAFTEPGYGGGGPISGHNEHDVMVMGLLRAAADVVLVGAGTLRSGPTHLWTAPVLYPALAYSYHALRESLGKPGPPLNVIVTARGDIDPSYRIFQSGEVPVLILTSTEGLKRIRGLGLPQRVQALAVQDSTRLNVRSILDAVSGVLPSRLLLVEGGPHLLGDFLEQACLDELFLTLAPQVAGRNGLERLGLVAGRTFTPDHPLWGTLIDVRRAASHLFLRYAFSADSRAVYQG